MTLHEQAAYGLGRDYAESGINPNDELDEQDLIFTITGEKIDIEHFTEREIMILRAFDEGYDSYDD